MAVPARNQALRSMKPAVARTTKSVVSDHLLVKFTDMIYQRAGVRIPVQKKLLLTNRLNGRLKATGLTSFDAYYDLLQTLPEADGEWQAFFQAVTTHETYLVRDHAHWQWFTEDFMPQLIQDARGGKRTRTLRIWSAACSTGDEAFTAATCLARRGMEFNDWKITILGTDIGADAVAAASAGEFNQRAMQHVSDRDRRRCFDQIDDQRWRAKAQLRQWTTFRRHNLLEPFTERPFDVVFLKNVLIYFDAQSKQRVLEQVDKCMSRDGYLVTTAAEGIANLLPPLGYQRLEPWLYRRGSDAKSAT